MRVILMNRGLHSHYGGDLVQVEETHKALLRVGIQSYVWPEDPQLKVPPLGLFDLAHVFHVNFGFSKANWKHCREAEKKFVVTPIYYDASEVGMTYEEQKQMMREAARVMPFTEEEEQMIKRCCGYDGGVSVIPNGTSERFHSTHDPMRRTGVLAVSAREGAKGTETVRELCEELGYPFTLGQGVPNKDMPELYQRHRVFVHAADLEVMSLVIGEALAANCRVLATETNPGNAWYPGLVEFDPHVRKGKEVRDRLRWLMQQAYENTAWDYSPNEAARRITWGLVAGWLKEVYKEALNG